MNRAERRRIARKLGVHRAPSKKGRRPAVRQVRITVEDPEEHRPVIRLPFGLEVVRRNLALPEGK